jgi:ribosome maturation factor RimP
MANEVLIQEIKSLLEPLLEDQNDVFLVDIRIKPTNNIKIFLDADTGVSIEKCVSYNRALYKIIEEKQLFPEGDFSLEVSSPGLDEPLKLVRQYRKNIGRLVEVVTKEGTKVEGKLMEATEEGIVVEQTKGKGKKAEIQLQSLLFDQIKTTKIQIVF